MSTAPNKEIGWYPVFTKPVGEILSWFHQLFEDAPTVFHWHSNKFQIPYGRLELLVSQANTSQAFLYSDHVLGLQFHLETTRESLGLMLENCRDDLQAEDFIQSAEELTAGNEHNKNNQRLMAEVLSNFWRAIDRQRVGD